MADTTEARVHRYSDESPDAWAEFIKIMRSGEVFECDEEMFYYWLEVLPPVYMGRRVELPSGRIVKASFGFAEGREQVVAFWQEGERYFGCRTNLINPHG